MRRRCPGARPIGRGMLGGYRLSFRGRDGNCHATIDHHAAGTVPVLLWNITRADEAALDRYEGFPSYYRKEPVEVCFGDGDRFTTRGDAYVMNGGEIGRPSASYYEGILQAYRDAGIDERPLEDALFAAQSISRGRADA